MSWEATLYAQNVCRLMDRSGRAVLNALAWRAAKETPAFVFMKREDIFAATGIADKKTVQTAIKRLEKAGELKVLKVGGIRENGKSESTDFELVGVRQWLAAGKPSREQWEGPKPEEPRGEILPQSGEILPPIGTLIGNHLKKEGGEKNPRANAPRETANKQRQSPKTNRNPSLLSFLTSERSDEDRARITRAMVAQCPGDDEAWHEWLRVEFARVGVDTHAEWEACTKYRRKKKLGDPMRADLVGWLLNAATKKKQKGGPVKPPRKKNAKPAGPDAFEMERAFIEAFHAGQVGEGGEAEKEWRRCYVDQWRKRAKAQPSGPRVVRDEHQEMKDELEMEQAAAGKVIPIGAAQHLAAAS